MSPRIALTGGIASGKSTVGQLFMALGARLIDTDQIARDIVAPPSPVLDQIVQRFGHVVLDEHGQLKRRQLRDIIFSDAAARADLEAITHPAIRARVAELSSQHGAPYQLIAIPLLAEKQTAGDYDRVLVVDCDPVRQRRRLMLRDGLTEAAAQRIIDSQATREQRLAIADDVIINNGDIATLATQVEALHQRYLTLGVSA
jgi:dephospho-CoA kinase